MNDVNNLDFNFSSTVAGTWVIDGLPDWIDRIDTPTSLSLSSQAGAAHRGQEASPTVWLVSDAGVLSQAISIRAAVRPQGLSPLAYKVRIDEYVDWEVSGGHPEFVELRNTTDTSHDLDGLTLRDYRPDGPPDAPASFSVPLDGITLGPGQSTVLWINGRRSPGVSGGHVFNPDGPATDQYLQSAGDDLWIVDDAGLVMDYVGWGAEDHSFYYEYSGGPAPYLGFCQNIDPCWREADPGLVTPGWSWKRAVDNHLQLTEGPADPTVN